MVRSLRRIPLAYDVLSALGRSALVWLGCVWLVSCAAPRESSTIVRVGIRTDLPEALVGGLALEVTVSADPESCLGEACAFEARSARPVREVDPLPADGRGEGLRSRAGVRVAEFRGVASGSYRVKAAFVGPDGIRHESEQALLAAETDGVFDVLLSILHAPIAACDDDCACPCAEGETWPDGAAGHATPLPRCALFPFVEDLSTCECEVETDCASLDVNGLDCGVVQCVDHRCAMAASDAACDATETCRVAPDGAYACDGVTCRGRGVGEPCRPPVGPCDLEETCASEGGACGEDQRRAEGEACNTLDDTGNAVAGRCVVQEGGGVPLCVPDCVRDADCDDGIGCTDEVCTRGLCVPTPIATRCDDGVPCTEDACDLAADPATAPDGCRHSVRAAGSSCSNGTYCDGDETCDAAGACVRGPERCDRARYSGCDEASGCVTTIGCMFGAADAVARCAVQLEALVPEPTAWSACGRSGTEAACTRVGVQERVVYSAGCAVLGYCSVNAETERRACELPFVEDVPCAADTVVGAYSACEYPDGTCAASGSRTRTVTRSRCTAAGTCESQSTVETDVAGCARVVPDGTTCRAPSRFLGPCGGFRYECSLSGTRSVATTPLVCTAGRCGAGTTVMSTEACTRPFEARGCSVDECSLGLGRCDARGACTGSSFCASVSGCMCSILGVSPQCIRMSDAGVDGGGADAGVDAGLPMCPNVLSVMPDPGGEML